MRRRFIADGDENVVLEGRIGKRHARMSNTEIQRVGPVTVFHRRIDRLLMTGKKSVRKMDHDGTWTRKAKGELGPLKLSEGDYGPHIGVVQRNLTPTAADMKDSNPWRRGTMYIVKHAWKIPKDVG